MGENINELVGYHECDADHVERAAEVYRNDALDLLLTLCRHHGRELELALRRHGFTLMMMAREPEPV